MKVFYNSKMSVDSGSYSPSGSKPAAAVADWLARGLAVQIVDFEPATEADLCLAHNPKFVRQVLKGRSPNGHGNRRKAVTNSCRWTVGSLVAAAREALTETITCSPSSGFHHAGYAHDGAYCTFNGMIVAARQMMIEGRVSKVGILDADMHYGDGTQDIIDVLNLHDEIKHWTFGSLVYDLNFHQDELLCAMGQALQAMKADGVELIIYQAGADPHKNDPLGGLMTSAEMRERDAFVFKECMAHGMPVVFDFAGGYQRDANGGIEPVLELHRATAEEAIRALAGARSTTKKWIRMIDTTAQSLGKGIAIIGGVRAPRNSGIGRLKAPTDKPEQS